MVTLSEPLIKKNKMIYDIKLVDTQGTNKFYPADKINELHFYKWTRKLETYMEA